MAETSFIIENGRRLDLRDASARKSIGRCSELQTDTKHCLVDAINELYRKVGSGGTGSSGKDGITPHIGANGNWYIGETDTGVAATGPQGPQGIQGIRGKDGPPGVAGPAGPTGSSGVYVGTTAPSDEAINVWINPNGEGQDPTAMTSDAVRRICT